MKSNGLIKFLILVVIVVAVVLYVRSCNTRTSILIDDFDKIFAENEYVVFDNFASGDEASTYESKIENFDDYKTPFMKHTAVYGGRTEVIFLVYDNEESAVQVEKRYENAQQVKVYKEDFMKDDYLKDAKSATTRKGDNYQRYYTKTLTGNYVLISQIDNTMIVASVDKLDIDAFNKIINKIKY